MIWILIALLACLAMLALAAPFLRRDALAAESGLGVFRGQLDEVERDREIGLISDQDAAFATREIERRWLAASRRQDEEGQPNAKLRQGGLAVTVLSVIAAVAIYFSLGRPELVGVEAPQQAELPPEIREVFEQVEALAQFLVENPANPDGWTRLGQAYMAMRQYGLAAQAFENALDYRQDDALLFSQLGEALFFAQGGLMTPAARESFARALDLDANEAGARFYMAEALFQSGDIAGARNMLENLRSDFPDDESLAEAIEARLEIFETGPVSE